MLKHLVTEDLEPIDMGSHGLDKNQVFTRTFCIGSLKIWHYSYTRHIDMKDFCVDKPNFKKKVGFKEEQL